jgi:hypothetical protein
MTRLSIAVALTSVSLIVVPVSFARSSAPAQFTRLRKPAPVGDKANPVALGKSAPVHDGWKLSVVSVSPNAAEQVLDVTTPKGETVNVAPPAGARDYMLLVKAMYTGVGKGNLAFLLNNMFAVGSYGTRYQIKYDTQNDSCGRWPEPSFQYARDPRSGQTLTGYVCFQILSSDAASLRFYVELTYGDRVWFSLRSAR